MSHSQDHFYNYIVLNLVVSVWLFTSEYWPSRVEARRRRFAVLGSLLVHFYQQEQNTAKHMRKHIEHFISLLPQWFLDSSEDEGIWASSGVHLARNVCLLLVKAVKQRGKGSNQPSLSRGREGRQKKRYSSKGDAVCVPSTSDSHQSHSSGSRGKHGIPLHRAFKTSVEDCPEKPKTVYFHFVVTIF